MRRLGRPVSYGVALAASTGALLVVFPGHAGLVGHIVLVAVLALALAAALRHLRRELPRRPSAFEAAFAPTRPTRARPASLDRVEREVTLATGTAFDVHFRLRPDLREVSAGLLARRGVDLDRNPGRAEALLGPDVWAIVRPDAQPPDDRTAPGLTIATIERALDALERVAWS